MTISISNFVDLYHMKHLKKILLLQYSYFTTPFQVRTCDSYFWKIESWNIWCFSSSHCLWPHMESVSFAVVWRLKDGKQR